VPNPPCERCGQVCRTEKPVYGWICANCAYELDRYYAITVGSSGGDPGSFRPAGYNVCMSHSIAIDVCGVATGSDRRS